MKFCPTCKKTWSDEMSFCPFHGDPLASDVASESVESPSPAINGKHTLPASQPGLATHQKYVADPFDTIKLTPDEQMQLCQKYIPETDSGQNVSGELLLMLPPQASAPNFSSTADGGMTTIRTTHLVNNALGALDQQRKRDLDRNIGNVKLFGTFNLYFRAVWDFIQELQKHGDFFRIDFDYLDEPAHLWVRFTVSLGEGIYFRSFPINIVYQREPVYEVALKINAYDIGSNHDKRLQRIDAIPNGRVEVTRLGYGYVIGLPPEIEERRLIVKWLKRSFNAVFQVTYAD